MSRAGSNERQREFVKQYERLCYRFGRHEVWQDFVVMAACAISNTVDKRHAEKREEWYLQTVKKYNPEEQKIFPELFALIVAGMEEHPDQDFLGELYMQLELGNAKNGQFFTPYSLCKCMAEIILDSELMKAQIKRRGYISINDPACGAGATLVAAAMIMKDKGINYQQQAVFVGQDIDYTVGLMCYIQLSLLGCAGYVHIGNTLANPMTGHVLLGDEKDTTWYTPMWFSDPWTLKRMAEKVRIICGVTDVDPVEDPQEEPPPEPVQEEEPTFTISTKKKNAGQLMFDFG